MDSNSYEKPGFRLWQETWFPGTKHSVVALVSCYERQKHRARICRTGNRAVVGRFQSACFGSADHISVGIAQFWHAAGPAPAARDFETGFEHIAGYIHRSLKKAGVISPHAVINAHGHADDVLRRTGRNRQVAPFKVTGSHAGAVARWTRTINERKGG